MKPSEVLAAIDADIAEHEQLLERKHALRSQLAELYGPPAAPVQAGKKAKRTKAVNGTRPRRQPIAPGSLGNRIIEVLTEFQAPMKRADLVEQVKARLPDVVAEMKALRAAERIVMVGERAGARYAVPKFAHVLVAETD